MFETSDPFNSSVARIRKDEARRYFMMSGSDGINNQSHHPIIAYVSIDGKPTGPKILESRDELLKLQPDTICLGQWAGQNRSDFFEFTAGEYQQFVYDQQVEERERKEKERKEKQLRPKKAIEEEQPILHPMGGYYYQSKLDKMMLDAIKILEEFEAKKRESLSSKPDE